jgi:hypothetical protein
LEKKEGNFLNLIPEINCRWESDQEGKVYLLVPRFKNYWMKKIALKLGKSELVKIFLDEIGTRSWQLIDGRRTVREIGEYMEENMGDTVKPVYERLIEFMSILFRNKFILFKNY